MVLTTNIFLGSTSKIYLGWGKKSNDSTIYTTEVGTRINVKIKRHILIRKIYYYSKVNSNNFIAP